MEAITTGSTTGEIRAHAQDLRRDLIQHRDAFMNLADMCSVEGANTCSDWQSFLDQAIARVDYELA